MESIGNKAFSGAIWKFMERITAQVVTFVVSIVLARLLTPEDYGTIAMINVFIAIANVFVVSGFGNALIQKKNADTIDFSSVFYFNITFSMILYGILFLLSPIIADFYNMPILEPGLRVLGVKLPLAAVNSVQQAYVSRKMIFKKFFFSTIIGTALSAVVGIGLAFLGYGVWALIAQYLTNSIVDTLVLWITVKWRPVFIVDLERLKGLISYGWKVLCQSLVLTVYDQLKSLIIGRRYSSEDLAYYNKGIQFPSLIITNINSSISSVLFPALSSYQDDRQKMIYGIKKSISIGAYLVFPLMAGMFVVATELIPLLLTEKWNSSIPFLRIACVYMSAYVINTANLQAINALGRSDVSLKLELLKRGFGLIMILISMRFGVLYMALSDLTVAIFAIWLNVYENSKLLGYTLSQQLKDIAPSAIRTMIMVVAVLTVQWMLKLYTDSLFIILAIESFVGALVYLLCSIVVPAKEMQYIIQKFKKR